MRRLRKPVSFLLAFALLASPCWAASGVYDVFRKNVYNNTTNLSTGTIKVILVNGYTQNVATHVFYSDVIASEVSGTGYTAGGVTLSGLTFTLNTSTHTCVVTCTNPSWSSATITATGAIVVDWHGTAATSPLISYIDFGGSVSSTAGTFAITTFNSNGIITD